jgi:ribosomal protein L37AE/L43A
MANPRDKYKNRGKQGEIKRTCPECHTEFTTDDARKIYDKRSCGNTFRSRRWYERAAKALRKQEANA